MPHISTRQRNLCHALIERVIGVRLTREHLRCLQHAIVRFALHYGFAFAPSALRRLTFRAPPLRYFSPKKLAHSTSKGAPLALTDFKIFSSASAPLPPDFKGFHFYFRRSVALFFRPSHLQTVRECACVRPQWLYFQSFE